MNRTDPARSGAAPPRWLGPRTVASARTLARGLGWFSIVLGVVELLAPRATVQATGAAAGRRMVRVRGLRQIVTGVGLVSARKPQGWLWARLGGDAVDAASLAFGLRGHPSRRQHAAVSLAAVLGLAALDAWAARATRRNSRAQDAFVSDYAQRVGLAASPDEMRGKARDALQMPPDLQPPTALRAYSAHTLH